MADGKKEKDKEQVIGKFREALTSLADARATGIAQLEVQLSDGGIRHAQLTVTKRL